MVREDHIYLSLFDMLQVSYRLLQVTDVSCNGILDDCGFSERHKSLDTVNCNSTAVIYSVPIMYHAFFTYFAT